MRLLHRQVAYGVEVIDLALAALLLALGELDVFYRLSAGVAYQGSRGYNALLAVLVAVGVIFRRRWSLPAVIWVTALVCLSRPYFVHDASVYQGFLPLIVLTAGAAVYEPRNRSIIALGVALAGLALYLSAEPTLRSFGNGIGDGLFILLPWVAAMILHARNQQAERLSSDLAQTKVEQAAREKEILAEERGRIARELHDVVAHSVSVMVVNVGAARLSLDPDQERARHALVVAEDTGRQALAELRRLLGVLREGPDIDAASPSPQPDFEGLVALADAMAASGLEVHLHKLGAVRNLSAVVELNAYRIIQEGLTNALKHGKATRADVTLRYDASCLTIEIVDNGRAVPGGPALPRSGHGLIGVRERALLFGGDMEAGLIPEGGWRLRTQLPLSSSLIEEASAVPDARPQ